MTTTPPDLPAFPRKPEAAHNQMQALARTAGYEHRRAEAYAARLLVAVEALGETAATCVECDGSGIFNGPVGPDEDCDACRPAREALTTIGEMPPTSEARGE